MKNITIDELAVMMQKEFSSLHEEISGVRTELKEEIQGVETRLRAEIQDVETRLSEEIKGVADSLRSDIRRIENSVNDIKERLSRIEQRSLEDDNALTAEVVDLRNRVNILEREIQKLKTA